ncbi:hypothetical protein NIES2104_09260 [Leptolyngbya sp. NIES-2104]|nr:hypothetical protein NIES2104_09260 [Leptolyngbya sp. NIES-2104]
MTEKRSTFSAIVQTLLMKEQTISMAARVLSFIERAVAANAHDLPQMLRQLENLRERSQLFTSV